MFAAEPAKNKIDSLAIIDELNQSTQSGNHDSKERVLLTFDLLHTLNARIRLKVKELKFDDGLCRRFVEAAQSIQGVRSVRANSWCASVIIQFDEDLISQEKLLAKLRKLQLGVQQKTITVPTLLQRIKLLSRFFLQRLEALTPPVVQLALGTGAFGSALLGAPLLLTSSLSALAVLPIAGRAAQTAIDERRIGVDGLDGLAAALMIAQGNLHAASFMTALIGIGEYIRELTAQRCQKMLDDLLGLAGCSAWLVKGNKRVCIPAEQVRVGDTVVVYPGELLPVDGQILRGTGSINQSALTGESMPVEVVAGSSVFAGTYLEQGKIYIQCCANVKDSRAGRVVEMVKSAPVYETRTQNYAAGLADKLVLPILATAAICGFTTRSLTRVMSVLIFDFSTGIRISAPTAVLASMQRAGQHGILIKSGGAVERLALVDAVVIDKTGTLTVGEPQVKQIIPLNSFTEREVLAYAAAVEERLQHPAARAILKHARQHLERIPDRDDSAHKNGMGVGAHVEGRSILCGSRRFMHSENIDIRESVLLENQIHSAGQSVAYVAIDGKLAGLISYSDKLRTEVPSVVDRLKKQGIKKIIMATGDHEHAAKAIAAQSGIKEVFANSFPEQKADLVKTLKAQGYVVAVVGDGINDSPALAHADLGVSLHSATDAARESSDVLLTDNDLSRLPEAIDISRKAMGLVRENLAITAVPNGFGLALAAAGAIGPASSTLLNNGSAILAALNSLRPLFSTQWTRFDEKNSV